MSQSSPRMGAVMVPRIALVAGSGVIVLLTVSGCAGQSAPPAAHSSTTTAVGSSAPRPATSSVHPTAASATAPATITAQPSATSVPAVPSAATTPAPTAPIVLPESDLPVPAATLPNAQAPAVSDGVATVNPVALPQYVPPDISQSGIAISVAGTRYTPGETIATSSQAAPELTGFTSYLLMAEQDGTITPVATGTVGPGGHFTLSFQPNRPGKLISAVAQAGVTPTEGFDLDNVIARSSVVVINTR